MVKPLFLAHGSPMMAIEEDNYTEFLNNLGKKLNPKAIVIFTAHWDSETLTISSSDSTYETVYDFYGFPEELYNVKYEAQGSSTVAAKVEEKLSHEGIKVKKDLNRGLDHGAWTLLKHLYPEANIPVVQVSIDSKLSIEEQIKIGNALKTLGDEDILVIGSGNTVHNLNLVDFEAVSNDSWAEEFDEWLINRLKENDFNSLYNYRDQAPNADLAVPSPEHFVPLFIALGSSSLLIPRVIFREYELGNLSRLCLEF
ncbi:DODA-type extradiol aromatic ring-opening family dioxygenase [Clostridium beijerinckii]|uniref:DODA-type extradiol aromatic ring-opening family dioxygenase n=1 Tax=Clostridium beijerinckii TaxID=1520 RepID=UPI00098CB6D1|nr:class III extradiol ring-cleavage dioxygenase [Clostridium beijerinckii]NRT76898.1 4,5-DOPA dioxygenase extradiol [Clostridium beijerinckii]OOM37054.1 LigB family dioxygenase [Clostridium beijerinckii]